MRKSICTVWVMLAVLTLPGLDAPEAGMTLIQETEGSREHADAGGKAVVPGSSHGASEGQLASGGEGRGAEQIESGVTPVFDASSETEPETRPDRRWIIKESGTTAPPATPEIEVKWESEDQERRCSSLIETMRNAFTGARYHSIRGDACRTARFSSMFLNEAEACRKECPEGFLERNGYTERIVRNVSVLLELGRKRCMDDGPLSGIPSPPGETAPDSRGSSMNEEEGKGN